MLIFRKPGADTAPDLKAWVESLTQAQLAFFTQIVAHAAEGDYSMFVEFYVHASNRYNELSKDDRHAAVGEATERFFSVEALEEYMRIEEGEQKVGGIILPGDPRFG
jgi:hypothetical protein